MGKLAIASWAWLALLGATAVSSAKCGGDGAPSDADAGAENGEVAEDAEADAAPICGNGTREESEECDDGNLAPGDGCEPGCTFSCHDDTDCTDRDQCTADVCEVVPLGRVCTNDPDVGAPCDDGLFCTINDTCDGSECNGWSRACPDPDGLVCTPDVCDEATDWCASILAAGYCLIGLDCYLDGATNPANQCQSCQPSQSGVSWSPDADGTPCDDGDSCTLSDACDAGGHCVGTPVCPGP